jgi:hypothetical protein
MAPLSAKECKGITPEQRKSVKSPKSKLAFLLQSLTLCKKFK